MPALLVGAASRRIGWIGVLFAFFPPHEELKNERKTGYTTILKLLQIMHEKGLVKRDESSRSHIYEPCMGREQTQRLLVGDLLERAFGGSAFSLVMQALSAKRASPDELAEISKLLKGMKTGKA